MNIPVKVQMERYRNKKKGGDEERSWSRMRVVQGRDDDGLAFQVHREL